MAKRRKHQRRERSIGIEHRTAASSRGINGMALKEEGGKRREKKKKHQYDIGENSNHHGGSDGGESNQP